MTQVSPSLSGVAELTVLTVANASTNDESVTTGGEQRGRITRLVVNHGIDIGSHTTRSSRSDHRSPLADEAHLLARLIRLLGNSSGILRTARFDAPAESGRPRSFSSAKLRFLTTQPTESHLSHQNVLPQENYTPRDLNRPMTL